MNKPKERRKTVKIGILGNGFMGRMRAHAYTTVAHMFPDLNIIPELYAVFGIDEESLKEFANNFKFRYYTTNWMDIINDNEVDIVNVCLPEHVHAEPSIQALNSGKHVFCEKALAYTTEDAYGMVQAAQASSRISMCGLNYRFFPSIQLAQKIIEEGQLGEIYSVRANYFQDSGHDPNRPAEEVLYAYGDHPLGSSKGLGSHVIDMCRFLIGGLTIKSSFFKTFIPKRLTRDGEDYFTKADDFATMTLAFDNGAVGIITTSKIATGRKNWFAFEINGSKASLEFDLDKLNILKIYNGKESNFGSQGFNIINVTEKEHPYMDYWWPPSHNLGWEHSHINEIYHFLKCISGNEMVSPRGATFKDGYEAVRLIEEAEKMSQKSSIDK